jgi:hypothetical protein
LNRAITHIYHEKKFQPFAVQEVTAKEEAPNILNAFMGILSAGTELDNLIERVESTILDIEDTLTIAEIQRYRGMVGTGKPPLK